MLYHTVKFMVDLDKNSKQKNLNRDLVGADSALVNDKVYGASQPIQLPQAQHTYNELVQ